MKIYYDNGDVILLEKYKKIRLYHKNTIINVFLKILFINKNYGSFSFFIIIIIECSLTTTTTTTTSSSSSLAVVELFLGDKRNLEINFYHATVRITRVNQ